MIGFKTVEKTGAKGFSVGSGNVPQNGVVYYDGSTAPEGWEEIESPVEGTAVYSGLLFYGHTTEDEDIIVTPRPWETHDTYNDASDYISVNAEDGEIEILKDFFGVLTPWCECQEGGTSNYPEIGIKLNNTWLMEVIQADKITGEVGGIRFTKGQGSNVIILQLKAGDIITIQKVHTYGWSIGHLKIYKLFGTIANGDMEGFIEDMGVISSTVTESTAQIDEG